jgi:hypothetical protein
MGDRSLFLIWLSTVVAVSAEARKKSRDEETSGDEARYDLGGIIDHGNDASIVETCWTDDAEHADHLA